jgi:hypothetical protein
MYVGLRPRQGRARPSGLTGSVTEAVYGTCVEQVMSWRCQDRKMVLRYLLEDGHGGARLMGALAGCQKENQERTITRNIPILGALVLSCYTAARCPSTLGDQPSSLFPSTVMIQGQRVQDKLMAVGRDSGASCSTLSFPLCF